MRHDMESHMTWIFSRLTHVMKEIITRLKLGGEDQDEAWLDGPVARVKGKSEALKRWTAWRDA